MSLHTIRSALEQVAELRVLDRSLQQDTLTMQLAALCRTPDGQVQLLALQYDEAERERRELEEIELLTRHEEPRTNRAEQRPGTHTPVLPLSAVRELTLGGHTWPVTHSSSGQANDLSRTALLTLLLQQGWAPGVLENRRLEDLYFTSLTLKGTFDRLPDFDARQPVRLLLQPQAITRSVEQPLLLRVGEQPRQKLWFSDRLSGERHWLQVNEVTLCDMWSEMEKTFSDPRMRQRLTEEELAQRRAEFACRFEPVCPRGMRFACVSYECEDGISLQFYDRAWLEQALSPRGDGAMAFLMRAEQPVGRLGLPLKTAVIQTPLPPEQKLLDLELFSYSQRVPERELVL